MLLGDTSMESCWKAQCLLQMGNQSPSSWSWKSGRARDWHKSCLALLSALGLFPAAASSLQTRHDGFGRQQFWEFPSVRGNLNLFIGSGCLVQPGSHLQKNESAFPCRKRKSTLPYLIIPFLISSSSGFVFSPYSPN